MGNILQGIIGLLFDDGFFSGILMIERIENPIT